MTSVNGTGGPTTPAEIEADIIRQREELADTVSALQTKLDVKAKAKHKAAAMKDRATTETGKPRPTYAAGAAAALAALVGLVVWRRRRA
jgi:MYXO-CTERM domain-containing protein